LEITRGGTAHNTAAAPHTQIAPPLTGLVQTREVIH